MVNAKPVSPARGRRSFTVPLWTATETVEKAGSKDFLNNVSETVLKNVSRTITKKVARKTAKISAKEFDTLREVTEQPLESSGQADSKEGPETEEQPDSKKWVGSWDDFELHSSVRKGIPYSSPTQIQSLVLPHALHYKPLLAAAETGSGKTAAFVIPVLNHLARCFHGKRETERPLAALVIAPTRELALQIAGQFTVLGASVQVAHSGSQSTSTSDPAADTVSDPTYIETETDTTVTPLGDILESGRWGPPRVAAIVGGLSPLKQMRMIGSKALGNCADIVVATPGRLWDLLQSDAVPGFAERVRGVKFLVIDEGDRLLERGAFSELERILAHMFSGGERDGDALDAATQDSSQSRTSQNPDSSRSIQKSQKKLKRIGKGKMPQGYVTTAPTRSKIQIMVFSATLVHDTAIKQSLARRPGKRMLSTPASPTFADLVDRLPFASPPVYISTFGSASARVSPRVFPAHISLLHPDKLAHLAYFVLLFLEPLIVFVNTIPEIKMLEKSLKLLVKADRPVISLHAHLAQKQRLDHFDRFKASLDHPNACPILITTDVAARGLDLPNLRLIIHYDLPHTPELFIHRSGRSARREGEEAVSLLFVTPNDHTSFGRIARALRPGMLIDANIKTTSKKAIELVLPKFKIDHQILKEVKQRAIIVREIADSEMQAAKHKKSTNELRNLAREAELDVPSDMENSDSDSPKTPVPTPNPNQTSATSSKKRKRKPFKLTTPLATLKSKLAALIATPLVSSEYKHAAKYLQPALVALVNEQGGVDKLRDNGGMVKGHEGRVVDVFKRGLIGAPKQD